MKEESIVPKTLSKGDPNPCSEEARLGFGTAFNPTGCSTSTSVNGWELVLLGLPDVLSVGSSFGFARARSRVPSGHLVREAGDVGVLLWGASPIGEVGKQAHAATPIRDFWIPIQMSPQPPGSG